MKNYPKCNLCGHDVMNDGYTGGSLINIWHQDCAFNYFKGQYEMGNCFCGKGCIEPESYCDTCGSIADEITLETLIYG